MGVETAGAEVISPFTRTGKVPHPFPVKTGLPIFIDISVAFTTEAIAFCKVYQVSVIEAHLVSILGIMAIEAPPHRFSMMKFDVGVFFFQDPLFSIDFHGSMAVAAWEHAFRHRRRRIFLND